MLSHPSNTNFMRVIRESEYIQQRRQVWVIEIHVCGGDLGYELLFAVLLQIVFRGSITITPAGSTERRSYIRHLIELLARFFIFIDSVVIIFQVPVADQGHHDSQAVELPCSLETVVPPVPRARFLRMFRMPLEPHAFHVARRGNELLPAS